MTNPRHGPVATTSPNGEGRSGAGEPRGAPEVAGPVRLLVVDDRPENLVAVEAVLRNPEYELVSVGSGQDALKFLLREDCALILMDVQMPLMDGFEAARLIRSNQRTRAIPIVFMTAVSHDERFVALGYGTGAVDYLLKPIDPDVLRAKVAAFVELYRAKQEVVRQAALLRVHEQGERRRAIAELELRNLRRERAAQERYGRMLEGITQAFVWALDPATLACTFVSSSAETILGRPADAWSSGPSAWLEVFPEADREGLLTSLGALAAGGPKLSLEHRLVRADGRLGWFQTDVRVGPAEEEGRVELRAFSVDVTEQRVAEQGLEFLDRAGTALASSIDLEETLRLAARVAVPFLGEWSIVRAAGIADDAGALVAVAHADASREDLVRAIADDGGLPRASAGGRATIVEDLRGAVAPEAARAVDALRAAGPVPAVAIALEARDRALGTLLLVAAPGQRWGTRELRLAEEIGRRASQAIDHAVLHREVRDAVRVREEFISLASHELRTPLTPLNLQLWALQRVLSALPDGAERAAALQRITTCSRQVERMTRLVSNLLDLTRLRAGRLELAPEDFDLAELTEEIGARAREELARSGRAVEIAAAEPVIGRWDRARLDQVITNLVSNAVRYGGEGAIRLAVRREAETAIVCVADEGNGIPSDDLARVFDKFGTGGNARGHGGLGLGLYITRRIVEAHGGRIAVESAVGRGSTFTVELPLAAAAARAATG
jgi:signal transduction histidine kinase/DNA-binding response OmpR family regulator